MGETSEIMGTPNSSEGVALTVPGKSFGKQVHNWRIEDPRCCFAAGLSAVNSKRLPPPKFNSSPLKSDRNPIGK